MMADRKHTTGSTWYIERGSGDSAEIIEVEHVDLEAGVVWVKGNNPFNEPREAWSVTWDFSDNEPVHQTYVYTQRALTITLEFDEQTFKRLLAWFCWHVLNANRLN